MSVYPGAVGVALACFSCAPALADPPALTTGPVVTLPGYVPLTTSLLGSERGLAVPFSGLDGLAVEYIGTDAIAHQIIVSVPNSTVLGGGATPFEPADYSGDTGTVTYVPIAPGHATTFTSTFSFTYSEDTTTNVTTVGGGITAIVSAGGIVLGSATAASSADAQAMALAGISTAGLPGRVLAPTVSTGGVVETITETSQQVLSGRDTYFAPSVLFGPDTAVVGNRGRCDVTFATCEGGLTFSFDESDNFDAHYFQDLYVTTVIDRTVTSNGTVVVNLPLAANGFAHPAAQTVGFGLSDRFLARILSPGVLAYGAPGTDGEESGATAFLEGTGLTGSYKSDGPMATSDFGFAGMRGGLSGPVTDDLVVGAAFGADRWTWSLADDLLPEDASGDSIKGGVFARWTPGQWQLNLASFVGRQGIDSTSTSTVGGGTSIATYDATLYGAGFEAGYALPMGGWTLTPSGGVSWMELYTPAFAETGGLAPLSVEAAKRNQVRPGIGLAADTTVDLGEGRTLNLGASGRIFGILGDRQGSVTASDGGLSSATTFTVDGPDAGSFGGEIGAHATLQLTDNATFTASWSSNFTSAAQGHAGQLGFKLQF